MKCMQQTFCIRRTFQIYFFCTFRERTFRKSLSQQAFEKGRRKIENFQETLGIFSNVLQRTKKPVNNIASFVENEKTASKHY